MLVRKGSQFLNLFRLRVFLNILGERAVVEGRLDSAMIAFRRYLVSSIGDHKSSALSTSPAIPCPALPGGDQPPFALPVTAPLVWPAGPHDCSAEGSP